MIDDAGEFRFLSGTPAASAMSRLLTALVFLAVTAKAEEIVPAYREAARFVKTWGREGGAPGEFSIPIGIALNEADEIFITDHYNQRVQKFDAEGGLLAHFPGHPCTTTIMQAFPGVEAMDIESY